MTRVFAVAAVVVAVALGLAAGFALYRQHQSRDIRGSEDVEFVADEPASRPPQERGVVWPTYGYDAARVRAPGFELRPPYRKRWQFGARNLIEFPPVIAYGRLYFSNNSGVLFAVNARTGKRAWRFRSGRCVAASPAASGRLVYQAFMNRPPCNAEGDDLDGEIIAFYAGSGKVRWRRKIGPSETSPLVVDGRLYVGDWRGRVYALKANTGNVLWTYETGDEVKGALAYSGDRVFVGSYDHHVYALDARTGKRIWDAGAQERLGPRGTFYSTPAVAYGRVYVGSTDGKVYSFGAESGEVRWSHDTGDFVYSSPAVWRRRVYVGSYSGEFYAFDAATGDVEWSFRANGPISGSPTVMNGVVYFATLEERTYALDARTGEQLWTYPDGKYTPVVADRERVYLVGYARVYGMDPQ
jgi:outer membrane protein assembly factor BamB